MIFKICLVLNLATVGFEYIYRMETQPSNNQDIKMKIYDLIGIGFGPSNIALAIALEENDPQSLKNVCFIEKQASFAWHNDMMLENAHMQISFLKDLVSLRNPKSHYSFINYLHENNRLADFINLKTFYPSRTEFNDYLKWAASHFHENTAYSETVFEVIPQLNDLNNVTHLLVKSYNSEGKVVERLTKDLVISVGGTANVPEEFKTFKNDPRIIHSSKYLSEIKQNHLANKVAVIGAGQSAAEIFMDLNSQHHKPSIDLIMRARAIKPSDSSPYVNEIFNAEFTDYVFDKNQAERQALLEEFWHTNYAAPDLEVIQSIYDVFYQQKVTGSDHHSFLRGHQVSSVLADENGVHIIVKDLDNDTTSQNTYDTVVLATGYQRQQHLTLLAPLAQYLNDYNVDRTYCIKTSDNFEPKIYLQGSCEKSHGLSDTLLSIMSVRSHEIVTSLSKSSELVD